MTALARSFLAVVPPDDVLDSIGARVAACRERSPSCRWMSRPQWHVTLKFLGRVPDVDAVAEAVGRGVATVPAFTARLGGSGAFPRAERARVLWVGVQEGEDAVRNLAAVVDRSLAPLGHEPEARPFHPHLTVARLARPRSVRELLQEGFTGPAWTVGDVVLFESDTRPDRAYYTERGRLPLATSDP